MLEGRTCWQYSNEESVLRPHIQQEAITSVLPLETLIQNIFLHLPCLNNEQSCPENVR